MRVPGENQSHPTRVFGLLASLTRSVLTTEQSPGLLNINQLPSRARNLTLACYPARLRMAHANISLVVRRLTAPVCAARIQPSKSFSNSRRAASSAGLS